MPKNKKARAEGFKRGLKGKRHAAGVTRGWTDDKASGIARNLGGGQEEAVADRGRGREGG
jgi:hypothetical protein